jgi:hypothetical protein
MIVKKWMVIFVSLWTVLFCAHAFEVTFSSGEGYSTGLLDGQRGWISNIETNDLTTWNVDSTAGVLSTSSNFVGAVYGGEALVLAPGGYATSRANVKFEGTILAVNSVLFQLGFAGSTDSNVVFSTSSYVNKIFWRSSPDGVMQLRNNNNAAGLSPNIGLDLGSASDDWAIEVSLQLGDTAAESIISAKLINVTENQSSPVGSYTGINSEVFDAATSSGVYLFIGSGQLDGNGQTLTSVEVSSVIADVTDAPPVELVDDDFSSYSAGELLFQGPWSAQTPGWGVSNGVVSSTADFKRMVLLSNPISSLEVGETVEIVIDHQVGGSANNNTDPLFQFGLKSNGNNWTEEGFIGGAAGYNSYLDGTYKIHLNKDDTSSNPNAALAIAPTAAGFMLDSADDADGTGTYAFDGSSDPLRIIYSLEKTDIQDTFEVSVVFSNLTTGVSITPANSTATITSADMYNDDEIFFMLRSNGINTGNKDLQIDRIAVSVIPAPVPPPAGTIDFTSYAYVNGELNGQDNWSATSGFVVNTDATTIRRATDWGKAYYLGTTLFETNAVSGNSVTITSDFYFEGLMAAVNTTKATFGFTDSTDSGNRQLFYLSSTNFENGKLKIRNTNDGNINNPGSTEAMELPGTNDALRLTYTLTLGEDAASSVMSASLSNKVSGASASTLYTGINAGLYTTITNSGMYVRVGGGGGLLQGSTGLVVDKIQYTQNNAAAPEVDGFDQFVSDYGLSGTATDDADSDGLNDRAEYLFGGNPTNASDIGTQPSLAGGIYTFALVGDDSLVAHVLMNTDLVFGSWATNSTLNVQSTDGILSNYTDNVGTLEQQLFIQLLVE